MADYGIVQRSTMVDLAEQTRRLSGSTEKMSPTRAVEILKSVKTSGSSDDLPLYDGSYSVIPAVIEQTLATAQTYLHSDIKIEKIPYAEVSNNSGGITVTIGGE